MKQKLRIIRRIAVAVLFLGIASAARADDIADCNQSASAELRISGCSGLIASGVSGRNLAIAYVNRGIAYDVLNETDRAIADFTLAIEAMPEFSMAYYNRGVAYSALGELALAVADFDEAIRLNPHDPDAYDSRGFVLSDMRDFEGAIADFDMAIELDPGFGAAYYHRGLAHGALGELESGLADYYKALELGCLRHGWCPPRG